MENKDKNQENINKFYKTIYEKYLENISNKSKKDIQNHGIGQNELYLSYTPDEKSLEEKILEVKNESHAALDEAKAALLESKKALGEAIDAKNKAENLQTIVSAIFVVVALAFIGWLYTAIVRVQNTIDNFNERAIPLEKKITEFEIKEKQIYNDINLVHDYVDNKIESEINKTLLELYKSQLKTKQINTLTGTLN